MLELTDRTDLRQRALFVYDPNAGRFLCKREDLPYVWAVAVDDVAKVLMPKEQLFDHVLLRAARADAATGLLDIRRLGEMLSRIRGRIVHKPLDRVSPLAVPVMLEIGREPVYGEASEAVLAEAADDLIKEAMS